MPNPNDKDYEPQPGPSWKDADWRPENYVDGKIMYQRMKATKRLLKEDISLKDSLSALRASRPNHIDGHNWLILIIAAADQWPHPCDDPTESRDPLDPPPRYALHRAAHMLIGSCGLMYDSIDLALNFISSDAWPAERTAHSGSDSGSSHRPDLPGHAPDTDIRSEPRGVESGCLLMTGDMTDSDTSSNVSDDPKPDSQLDVYMRTTFEAGSTLKWLKRFDQYVKAWRRECEERRIVRRTQRWIYENVFTDDSRSTDHSSYVVHTRRAMRGSADKRKGKKREKRLQRRSRGYSSSTYVVNTDADPPSSQQRVEQYVKELRHQLVSSWKRFYGKNRSKKPQTDPEPKSKKNGSAQKLECWITPVRWIQQKGPNCGLAVLAMAARPILGCEVIAGGAAYGGGASNDGYDEMWRQISDAKMRSFSKARSKNLPWPVHMNSPSLDELQHRAIERNFSGRGEMFSATAMARLAAEHQCGRYIVRLVQKNNDPHETKIIPNLGEDEKPIKNNKTELNPEFVAAALTYMQRVRNDDDQMSEENKIGKKSIYNLEIDNEQNVKNVNCKTDKPLNQSDTEDIKQNVNSVDSGDEPDLPYMSFSPELMRLPCYDDHSVIVTQLGEPAWIINIVERLMNGQLIAICFDCNFYMMPCSTNGGQSAHWALLCGVIIETPPQGLNEDYTNDTVDQNNYPTGSNDGKSETMDQHNNDGPKNNNEVPMDDKKTWRHLSSNVDLGRVWVVARHGKYGSRYALWPLKDLVSSNQQLHMPNNKIFYNLAAKTRKNWMRDLINDEKPPKINKNGVIDKELVQQFLQEVQDKMRVKDQGCCNQTVSDMRQYETRLAHMLELKLPETMYEWLPSILASLSVPIKEILNGSDLKIELEESMSAQVASENHQSMETDQNDDSFASAAVNFLNMLSPSSPQPTLPAQSPQSPSPLPLSPLSQSPPPPPLPPLPSSLPQLLPLSPIPQSLPLPQFSMPLLFSQQKDILSLSSSAIDLYPKTNSSKSMDQSNKENNYILPEGHRLDKCLANQFVAFEPMPNPYFVTELNNFEICDEDKLLYTARMVGPFLCHFSFDQPRPTDQRRQKRQQRNLSSSSSSTSSSSSSSSSSLSLSSSLTWTSMSLLSPDDDSSDTRPLTSSEAYQREQNPRSGSKRPRRTRIDSLKEPLVKNQSRHLPDNRRQNRLWSIKRRWPSPPLYICATDDYSDRHSYSLSDSSCSINLRSRSLGHRSCSLTRRGHDPNRRSRSLSIPADRRITDARLDRVNQQSGDAARIAVRLTAPGGQSVYTTNVVGGNTEVANDRRPAFEQEQQHIIEELMRIRHSVSRGTD